MIFIRWLPSVPQEELDLFLKDHSLADLLALVRLAHVIGLDDLYQLFFAVHQEARLFY